MPEAFKDKFDVLKTCDTGSSLYVERFPSLFLSTPETFLTCCHSLQAAGQQAGSSSAAGVMEQRRLTRGSHGGKDFVYF